MFYENMLAMQHSDVMSKITPSNVCTPSKSVVTTMSKCATVILAAR